VQPVSQRKVWVAAAVSAVRHSRAARRRGRGGPHPRTPGRDRGGAGLAVGGWRCTATGPRPPT